MEENIQNSENKEVTVGLLDMSKFFEWFFITSISTTNGAKSSEEFVNKVVEGGIKDETGKLNGSHRVRMFVNDIEVNPIEAVAEIQKQYEKLVERKAKQIVKDIFTEKFGDLFDTIHDVQKIVEERCNKTFPKAGK